MLGLVAEREGVIGARRLLCDDLGWRPDACGSRSGRGTGVRREAEDEGVMGRACPMDALNEAFEDDDIVRSLGAGLYPPPCRFLLDGIFLTIAVFSLTCAHEPTSSSPTGVSGIGRLAVEALDGVAIPSSCSMSCSRI